MLQAIVSPVVTKLFEALQSAGQVSMVPDYAKNGNLFMAPWQLPDEARAIAILQLETLTSVARGLTRVTDSLLALDDSPDVHAAMEAMNTAREDPRMVKLREGILSAIRNSVELWSTDATISDVSILRPQHFTGLLTFSISGIE